MDLHGVGRASEKSAGPGFCLDKGLVEEEPVDYIAGGDGILVAWSRGMA